ncbi:metallopeptidase family protein [Corynebacterium hindlerae]|uniref:metallopeptidase family protein n=1 Tax=Corynebacterium hindlerae TaxID=699041 RepID=UPI001AD643F5|nr:metallopeptidase family protein [Corynebacterium hindlerae]QTH60402.1 metallopeptidase family protein [Corynebacterium hindlerae]
MDVKAARNRHGRGVRGPLLPQATPRHRTRSQLFDAAVLEAYAPIANAYPEELATLDIAVDMIPRMRLNPDADFFTDEVVADGPVPLGRVIPAGIDRFGKATRPRVVVFRKPIEARYETAEERREILRMVLTTLVAYHLGIDPDEIDPGARW